MLISYFTDRLHHKVTIISFQIVENTAYFISYQYDNLDELILCTLYENGLLHERLFQSIFYYKYNIYQRFWNFFIIFCWYHIFIEMFMFHFFEPFNFF